MSTVTDAAIARYLLRYYRLDESPLYILADEAFSGLADCIRQYHPAADLRLLRTGSIDAALRLPADAAALLLAEPAAYVRHRLHERLDFSGGEPHIPGIPSKVLIFPADSLQRIFSRAEDNSASRDNLAASLQPHRQYRITTPAGTDLTFIAREWLPLDFEICTAPIETSVSGTIVVDGALFFRRITGKLIFTIRDGLLTTVTADTPAGEALADEYRRMTARDMAHPANCQLAEIGVGFCPGAAVTNCFMEAEAAQNTCHFCFGNNVCYGGANASDFHGASVLIRDPHFTLLS